MSAFTLRPAEPRDVKTLLELIRGLAIYERAPTSVVATEEDLLRDGFGKTPRYFATLAECENRPAGFSLCFYNYSTWRGHPGVFLEDLFVLPEFRGKGIGRALLADIARVALENDCVRIDWQVLDWNQPAIDFYERVGAKRLSEWFTMRVAGTEAIRALAGVVG